MPVRARTFFIVVAAAILLLGGFSFYRIITPRVVGRAVAPDGTEMCVIQWPNGTPVLPEFTTYFVYRRPGGLWRCFNYDFDDNFWANSRVSLDPSAQVAVFFRDGAPAITFAWASETYTIHPPRWEQTLTGSQSTLPADWSPPHPFP